MNDFPLYRVGHGYDVHKLIRSRPLILGGVELFYDLGLDGHSDADVLVHAIMDAILGAAALRDIGFHFPDNNPRFKGASSLALLERVSSLVKANSFTVVNIDATVIAQAPKLSPYIPEMIANISRVLSLPPGRVNVKATTEEGLGFTGKGEGIAAHAVAMLLEKPE